MFVLIIISPFFILKILNKTYKFHREPITQVFTSKGRNLNGMISNYIEPSTIRTGYPSVVNFKKKNVMNEMEKKAIPTLATSFI